MWEDTNWREETIWLDDFPLRLVREFLQPREAAALQQDLEVRLTWRQDRIRLFGREVPIPRQQCWVGDSDAHYRYSGLDMEPAPWPTWLIPVRDRVEEYCQWSFNAVLCNRYRSGADSVGWHSDDEPELEPDPLIASLTLGAERSFQLRHRSRAQRRQRLVLPHNSLLVMPAGFQRCWQHQLPKTRKRLGERFNLSFRRIAAATGQPC